MMTSVMPIKPINEHMHRLNIIFFIYCSKCVQAKIESKLAQSSDSETFLMISHDANLISSKKKDLIYENIWLLPLLQVCYCALPRADLPH